MEIATKTKMLNLLGLRPTGDLGPLTGYTTKRGRGVWYLKAPPKEPPTGYQIHYRNLFRLVAMTWQALPRSKRDDWLDAARRASLRITGYNLFLWYYHTRDLAVIRTVEHQTGFSLLP